MIALAACTKELPFPNVNDDPELVVNSLFSPDGEFLVHVSQSCHVTDLNCDFNFVENATVNLKDESGNILSSLEHVGDGIYKLEDINIKHDEEYQLEVSTGNTSLESVTSKNHVPKDVKCKFLGVEEKEIAGRISWAFDIEIDDDPSAENYYVISGVSDAVVDTNTISISETNGYIEPLMKHISEDRNSDNTEIALAADFYQYPLQAVYLTDKSFNGKTYKTTVAINVNELMYTVLSGELISELHVKSVSKEMYEYLTSIERKKVRVADPFSEPIPVFSNIENGIGIFAGFAQKEFAIDLPESEYNYPEDIKVENDGCTAPCTVSFSTIGGGSKLNYYWDFGDGGSSTEKNTEHEYTEPGSYQIDYNAARGNGDGFGSSFPIEIK